MVQSISIFVNREMTIKGVDKLLFPLILLLERQGISISDYRPSPHVIP